MKTRRRGRSLLVTAVVAALMLPTQVQAAGGGGHGGSGDAGGGEESTGSLYSDLVLALRDAEGAPVLKQYTVPGEGEDPPTVEQCVQPVSYERVPGVTASTNPVNDKPVWVLPLQGEWLPNPPVEEIEACDPQPQYAMFVSEVELERLNLARTSDDVIASKLADVEEKLLTADEIGLDGAGRLTVDGLALDASPEYAAIYQSLMKDGTIPGLHGPDVVTGPPAQVSIFDAWKLAAVAIGTAASKETPVNIDTVEYYNRVVGFPATDDYASPWGVEFVRSQDPADPGTQLGTGERFVDYSGFSYNRSETFKGSVTWLDVDSMTWQVSPIADVVKFTNLTPDPIGDRTLTGVTAFAQLADDVRAAILYFHGHEVNPGFYMDPVGVDTTTQQEKSIKDPAVAFTALPDQVFKTFPFQMTTSVLNPWGGTKIEGARVRITVDAGDQALAASDLQVTAASAEVPFQAVAGGDGGGDLVGWWGPEGGFTVNPGDKPSQTFDVVVDDQAPETAYTIRLELVAADASTVLATDLGAVHVNPDATTVLWGGEVVKRAVLGDTVKVPLRVYAPADGSATLKLAVTGPTDDPDTDLVEALKEGDVKVYAEGKVGDTTDMVRMSLTLDAQGRLVGTWPVALSRGYTDVLGYLTAAEDALVGTYTLDVGLADGNDLTPAMVTMTEAESHSQKPPDVGEDTTAPDVTITVVGTLSATAGFTLSSNEDPDVTYTYRLVEDDAVTEEWTSYTGGQIEFGPLEPGTYSFQVHGTDAAGNRSGLYQKTWTVKPPVTKLETSVLEGPADATWLLDDSASFTLFSNDDSAQFKVTVNGKDAGISGPNVDVTGLVAGANELTFAAVSDTLVDTTPVTRTLWVPRSVAALRHRGVWRVLDGPEHLFGTSVQTMKYGGVIKTPRSKVKRVALVVSKGAGFGKVRVYLGSRRLTRRPINLASSTSRSSVLVPVKTFARAKRGRVKVKVVSGRGARVVIEGVGYSNR